MTKMLNVICFKEVDKLNQEYSTVFSNNIEKFAFSSVSLQLKPGYTSFFFFVNPYHLSCISYINRRRIKEGGNREHHLSDEKQRMGDTFRSGTEKRRYYQAVWRLQDNGKSVFKRGKVSITPRRRNVCKTKRRTIICKQQLVE